MDIEVEASHHEVAIGQHEIDFEYGDALTTADRAVTFKYVLKAIAQTHGLHATFMPKPLENIAGSGMHVHQSLGVACHRTERVRRQRAIPMACLGLPNSSLPASSIMRAPCAACSRSLGQFLPPAGARIEAPVYVSWARTNRSALLRVPAIRGGQQRRNWIQASLSRSLLQSLSRLCRHAGGRPGRHRERPDLTGPVEENLYHFTDDDLQAAATSRPSRPPSARQSMRWSGDEWFAAALGDHVFERLIEAQRIEWNAFRKHVSGWERTATSRWY